MVSSKDVTKGDDDQTDKMPRRGPSGDVIPNDVDPDPRTRGGAPQEEVEDRPMVSQVTPDDYPERDRTDSRVDRE